MEDPNGGGGNDTEPIKKKLKGEIKTMNKLIVDLDRNKEAIVNVLKYLTPPEMYVVMRSSVEDREFAELIEIWKLVAYATLGPKRVSLFEGVLLGTSLNDKRVVTRATDINYFHLILSYYVYTKQHPETNEELNFLYNVFMVWGDDIRLDGSEYTLIYRADFRFQKNDYSMRMRFFVLNFDNFILQEGINAFGGWEPNMYHYIFVVPYVEKDKEIIEDLKNLLEEEPILETWGSQDDSMNHYTFGGREMTFSYYMDGKYGTTNRTPFRVLYRLMQMPGISIEMIFQTTDAPDKNYILPMNKKI